MNSESGTRRKNVVQKKVEEAKKLMFGLLFSTKFFVQKINPRPLDVSEKPQFSSLTTAEYRIHYWESMSGLRFALTTDPSVPRVSFDKIYAMYVSEVVKNPFQQTNAVITAPSWGTMLEKYIASLPFYM